MIGRSQTSSKRLDGNVVRRSGTAATEFVLILPVLIGIALGCVDLGRGVFSYIALTNAVREGAMYGATTGFTDFTKASWETEIRSRVTEEMQNGNDYEAADLTTSVTTETDADDTVRLTVTGTYPFETIVDWPGLPHRIELRHQVSMQRFR
ncbi:MAG: TadE/TadG family type IV pilus assembly protein [Planctomycetaceae bacterium]